MSHPVIELGFGKVLLDVPPIPEGEPYRLFLRPIARAVPLGDFHGPQEDVGEPMVELVMHGEDGVKVLHNILTKMLRHASRPQWEVVKVKT